MKLTLLHNFRKDEQGGILAFYLVMFMVMMIGGGMAIDFMRHEIKREAMQDALDRGVLAAAGNAQTAGAATAAEIAAAEAAAVSTVRSYVSLAGFNPDTAGVTVQPSISALAQRVDASANFSLDTYFLRLTGIDILNGAAIAGAAVSFSNIEMSLVLDVSGSMDFDVYDSSGTLIGRRIDLLQSAANQFADTLLSGDRPRYTSISVVPYSGQVALPNYLADEYVNFGRWNPWHNYSNCMKFNASDYTTTAFGRLEGRYQYEHFNVSAGRGGGRPSAKVPWCPDSTAQVVPLINDLQRLKSVINNLTPQGATNTWTGIKWGTALLDSSTQPIVSHLTTRCPGGTCIVDPTFSSRPAPYSDPTTLKFMVVMSDGANTSELLVPHKIYNVWHTYSAYTQKNADYWDQYYADGAITDSNGNYLPNVVRTSGDEGDVRMQNICTAAKNAGITIFTIGTDIDPNSNAYTQMLNCASTPGHFYAVGAADLGAAFASIANTIQKLRLVN